jgi:transposase
LSWRRRNTRRWIPLHEVEHMADRIRRLEQAIGEAVQLAPSGMQEVIQAPQALWGIAVTIVAELGKVSRFDRARQLMGYCGAVSSDHSSGKHVRRGQITKTGNAHLRRIAMQAAWAYRHRPTIGAALRKRQEGRSEEVREIAWKAQHRLISATGLGASVANSRSFPSSLPVPRHPSSVSASGTSSCAAVRVRLCGERQ